MNIVPVTNGLILLRAYKSDVSVQLWLAANENWLFVQWHNRPEMHEDDMRRMLSGGWHWLSSTGIVGDGSGAWMYPMGASV